MMLLKTLIIIATTFLKIAISESRQGTVNDLIDAVGDHGALAFNEFSKILEDGHVSLRGSSGQRLLQGGDEEIIYGPDGESMTRSEILDTIRSAISGGKVIEGEKKANSGYEDCKDLFNSFDANGDGFLSKGELATLFQTLSGCSRAFGLTLAQALIDWYDTNGDKKLSISELEAACKGDPHFVTWHGRHFSYHGACDLVLVHNANFADGKGLDLHVRTAHMMNGAYSFVSNAAIRIGSDVFEVISDGSHYLNGVLNHDLLTVGGFGISKKSERVCEGKEFKRCSDVISFIVELIDRSSISIKVASSMIHVDVKGSYSTFDGSAGLMGTYPSEHIGKLARDGQTNVQDADIFAQEWQVLEHEPKLFHTSRFPQHPQECIPAVQGSAIGRSLQEVDQEVRAAAEEACSHVDGHEYEFCIFDVLATGDYGMAATIYGR